MAMGSQREVGGEYLRMRMHLFEKCYMHAILHGLYDGKLQEKKYKQSKEYKVRLRLTIQGFH